MQDIPSMVTPSLSSTLGFVMLVLSLCVALVLGTSRASRALGDVPDVTRSLTWRTALGLGAWLGLTGLASASGVLEARTLLPPLLGFMLASLGMPVALALSGFGLRLARGLPVAALVLVQAFRLPLELILHAWKDEGVLPIQMTFEGRNFDIVSGVLALLCGGYLLLRGPSRPVALAFNGIGSALLVNVAAIAVLSSPVPFRRFMEGPPLLLAFHFPYGFIVPICVGGALFAHLVTFRALSLRSAAR